MPLILQASIELYQPTYGYNTDISYPNWYSVDISYTLLFPVVRRMLQMPGEQMGYMSKSETIQNTCMRLWMTKYDSGLHSKL
jgi:hypothetical protein